MVLEKFSQVAILNDTFRQCGSGVTVTRGVLGLDEVEGLLEAVRKFDTFTKDNDPYGEHDFGSVIWKNSTVLWKIDYYDQGLMFGEDPLSENCQRVITVMLAEEY